uniref:Uncharacterized protein n=1 Tax=Cynoglossus semilaevis TaxID=244447 RepID=A0A3P8X2P8_CYNSE
MAGVWCGALILLCCVLNSADSSPSSEGQRSNNNTSFRLTRSTRSRVHQLLNKYKEQQLGNKHFEDRRLLKDLPSLSTDYEDWIMMTDWERLQAALGNLKIYWEMLERKRKQLEKEQMSRHSSLSQSIRHIQLDLRDLMNRVSNQMRSSWKKPTFPSAQISLDTENSSMTAWDRRVEGYIILRDLDLYLTKLARDFLLLASNHKDDSVL